MPRKRPKSLDAPVVVQIRKLEAWAYINADGWKKSYRYTLVNEFRSHITAADYTKITIKPTYTAKAFYRAAYRHSKSLLRFDL